MDILLAIVYGIIQGIAEFLPISSSGHLAIARNIFGLPALRESEFTFDVLLHLGTLVAVFIVYYKDIIKLAFAFFSLLGKIFKGKFKFSDYTENERFCVLIIISTIPLVFSVFLKDLLGEFGDRTRLIGCILIINGFMLLISDTIKNGNRFLAQTTPKNALAIGLFQLLAILPGISRSGATITGGLLSGFDREYAVKYSFILSIPAILGANILSVADVVKTPLPTTAIAPCVVGMLTATAVGLAAIKLLIKISKKSNFKAFSYYCFAAGLLAIIFG